jgi:hypothetical protein
MGIYDGTATDWNATYEQTELPAGWRWSKKQMVCPNPNCGHRGTAASRPKGSRMAMWILIILLFPLGMIYAMFFSGYQHCCPKCRTVVDLA